MGKLNIKRVTLVKGEITPVSFGELCGEWLIKNFSATPVYVSFDSDLKENESVKIEKGMAQIVFGNRNFYWTNEYKVKTIYLKGEGEIEVQQLSY